MKPIHVNRGFSGFSIVELLTVVLIIGITAAISIPLGLNYVRHYQAMAAGQALTSQMQSARIQAVKRNSRNGMLLSLDYPAPDRFQFTSLDANPATGTYDQYYPGTGGPVVFDPNNPNYGVVPALPFNEAGLPDGSPSPHGLVIPLPSGFQFVTAGGQFTSLLFRNNGTVEGCIAAGAPAQWIRLNGVDFEATIRHRDNLLTRTVRISRNGRVTILNQ